MGIRALSRGYPTVRRRVSSEFPIPASAESIAPSPVQGGPYYSQFGEDRILSGIFHGVTRGTCAEVGAHNGVEFSNTYYFEQREWRCILVEPNPTLCDIIRLRRKSVLFECAASDRAGEAILHLAEDADVFSTLENNDCHFDRIHRAGGNIKDIRVKTKTLDSVLEESCVTELKFLSIDVEGHEFSVLRGTSLERWNPRVVLVEDNMGFADSLVPRHMKRYGYRRFLRTGCNHWYAHETDRELLTALRLYKIKVLESVSKAKRSLPRPVGDLVRQVRNGITRALHSRGRPVDICHTDARK
jgi:FkbM family methyltransferase